MPQPNRAGKKAITFWVNPQAKKQILISLVNQGYGSNWQTCLTSLLQDIVEADDINCIVWD